jgi:predicted nuclease of restriction endonuclease-like (RecB) superfamily
MEILSKENNIYIQATQIIDSGRKNIVNSIYSESTKSYFLLGKLIIQEEQNGQQKAQYGEKIIESLSKKLTLKYGKGFSKSTLKDCRKFYQKIQSLTGELPTEKSQSLTDQFKFRLSFTHYTYLIRLEDEQMSFYEKYAIEQNLSVRQLENAVQSNLFLRLKSASKEKNEKNVLQPKDVIKDPYILDFLGLEEIENGQEHLLESKLIENLEKFLLELGRGFAFVGRQYRLTLAEESYWADLVFYNIHLKCYVICELKTRKLKHSDLGQLQMYVNYFDRDIKEENDNPTIGILLCSDKNDKVVQYTLPKENQTIFASKYKLYLPSKEELEKELEN